MNWWQRFRLVRWLRTCPHRNTSEMLEGDRIQVCFDCGATRRPHESVWTQPWYWRELTKPYTSGLASG